jgi:hypothetical protein
MSDQPATESRSLANDAEFAERVLSKISEGNSVRRVAKQEGVPERTLRHWVRTCYGAFADSAQAKEDGIDSLAEQVIEIADDTELPSDQKRVMIDARLRLLGKWSRRYADKTAHEITGAEGGPIKAEVALAPDEAYKRMLHGAA